ncbi:MAG: RHS repeat-associated core domain-containing protein [Acidobacteria bacterium]|nr:RHS repeat-associated core domain-containing protein [Acidobacteriota bacterium]
MITNSQGAVISVHDYFPYGEDTTPTPNNRLKFTGQLRDQESDLDYFGARYYGSALGRFVSPDSNGIDHKVLLNPQGLNLYSYTINNPLRYIDPYGKDWIDATLGFGSGLVNSVVDTAKGIAQTVAHPMDTVTAIGNAIAHPYATLDAIAVGIAGKILEFQTGNDSTRGQIAGEVTGAIALAVAGTKGADKLAKASEAAVLAKNAATMSETVGAGLARKVTTQTFGKLEQNTRTTVALQNGSKVIYETMPGKTGGQATMIKYKDPSGKTKLVVQEARHKTKDFRLPPDHKHYKFPMDKELQ